MHSVRLALDELRQRIPGLRPVESTGSSLEVALARQDPPEMQESRLLEDSRARAHPVPVDVLPAVTAFLDGIQESRVAAYIGAVPLVIGRVAAVVRERVERRLVTWQDDAPREQSVYGPWSRLPQRENALFQEHGLHTREVRLDEEPTAIHPYSALQRAANAVKEDREALERGLATRFASEHAGTLYLDGSLPTSEEVLSSDRVVGVVKSHHTLYVRGADLGVVLALESGTRSSVFAVESRRRPPVASWYLRLRDPEGRDPFWGLVRIEIPMGVFESEGAAAADERSGWVLAERSPIALPDGRWDTMAYGIRNCEEFLRAANR